MSFLITGEFFTRHARDRVFEYGWPDAVHFVTSAIPEMKHEEIVSLLSGRERLTGDSRTGLDLEAEDDATSRELTSRHRWHYAGVWYDRSARVYFRPYARVTGWGEDDMARRRVPNKYQGEPHGPMTATQAGGDMEGWARYRSVHYMDDPVRDRVKLVRLPGTREEQLVLWRPCDAPPSWVGLSKSAEAALEDWCKEFGLPEERGAHITYQRERTALKDSRPADEPVPSEPPAAPAPASEGEGGGLSPELIRSLMPHGLPEHVADGLTRTLSSETPPPDLVATSDTAGTKWAWVGRDGKVWPCRGYMDHIPMATALAGKFGLNLDRWKGNAEHALEETGWVKLGHDAAGEPFVYSKGRTTEPQVRVVVDWLIAHGADGETIREWVALLQ